MTFKIEHTPDSHAGALDEETLSEVWDHLYDIEDDPSVPEFTEQTLEFFRIVNGVKPINAYANGLRVIRFLNFCNYYFPGNASIADWHVVRNRRWIADRLDPLVIPIAELAHGDYLCLDFADGNNPKVVHWDHEGSNPGQPQYHKVAPNLEAFISSIGHGN